jgi:hypothetical protein
VGLNVKLQLYAIKKVDQQLDSDVQLVVVDLDKSDQYPINFVCVLPRYFRLLEKRSSQFAKTFGPKSLALAKRLLVEADKKEDDPQIKKVINKRLKDIDSKQLFDNRQF